MASDLIIKRAEGSEIEAARLLTNRSWLSVYPALIGEAETRAIIEGRHSQQLFAEQAEQPDHIFLVAMNGGEVVGHCYAFPKDGLYVDRLHVDPDRRGGGVGKVMLSYLYGLLDTETRVWLDVLKGNDAAIGFYERVGYVRCGETDACGGLAGIPAIEFEQTIGGHQR